jgi:maleamate amidohydrolase
MDLQRSSLGLGERPALLLVDMINGFTSAECPLGLDCPQVVAANAELLTLFRGRGLPVFFTTVIYYDDSQATVFRGRIEALNVLQPGSHWVEVDPELTPLADESVIEKQWASAFFGTDLDTRLRKAGVDSLVVTGLTTSGCVRATVVVGLAYKNTVVVPREAVGDRNPDAHEANLFDMNAKYADVVSTTEVESLLTVQS